MRDIHIPVLLKETISFLEPRKGGTFIDATIGMGGHSNEIAKLIGPEGCVLALDKDEEALEVAKEKLKVYRNIKFVHSDFRDLAEQFYSSGIENPNGILIDLGVSSLQLDRSERGFSFRYDSSLDMRMDQSKDFKASDIVNNYTKKELIRIFKEYSDEVFAKTIAEKIIDYRESKKIETTKELREIVLSSLPKRYIRNLKIDPATKVFQALRIEVNDELEALKTFLPQAVSILKKGGKLAVISFHSLEDRIVKEFFREEAKECVCPKEFPICKCDKKPSLKIITKKPVTVSADELEINPRARSAKLRVAEKI